MKKIALIITCSLFALPTFGAAQKRPKTGMEKLAQLEKEAEILSDNDVNEWMELLRDRIPSAFEGGFLKGGNKWASMANDSSNMAFITLKNLQACRAELAQVKEELRALKYGKAKIESAAGACAGSAAAAAPVRRVAPAGGIAVDEEDEELAAALAASSIQPDAAAAK